MVSFLHSFCWAIAYSFYVSKCTGFQVMQSKIFFWEKQTYGKPKSCILRVSTPYLVNILVCLSNLLEDMMMESSLWLTNMALTKYGLRGKLIEWEMLYSHSLAMGVEEVLPQMTAQPPLLPHSTLLPKLELWKWSWTTRSHGDLIINCSSWAQALHKCRWPADDTRLGKEITWPHVFWWHVAPSPTCSSWLCWCGKCCLYLCLGHTESPLWATTLAELQNWHSGTMEKTLREVIPSIKQC